MTRTTIFLLVLAIPAFAAEPTPVSDFLKQPLLPADDATSEVRDYLRPKVPRLAPPNTEKSPVKAAADWEKEAERIRQDVLKNVVFRGDAAKWRDAKTKVECLDTIPGEGYRIKKVRYEILPDFWIPALLYEPDKLEGKVPVSLAVNGHDGNGKAADYKQIRCINMAKRGMIVLNVEWLGMGQLRSAGYRHAVMNQLDLCGSCGLAPFFLSMSRGLDILLAHPHADPKRVAVSGLSGGGWQTITISSLDTRVTLSNPVAGYSSFLTRIDHFKDLGDSEQTPCDLAMYADYIHLTAMMAPRATLLTFNAKDNCCFESGYALEPLRSAAEPFFKLAGREKYLRTHINESPGDHNFGIDNRQALYRAIGDYFYPDDKKFDANEIPCAKEVRKKDELEVPLPANTLDMNALAKSLIKHLPKSDAWPTDANKAATWQADKRKRLAEILRIKPGLSVHSRSSPDGEPKPIEKDGIKATLRLLKVGDSWTLPAVELVKGEAKGTTIVISDKGRASAAAEVERLLAAGQRVIAVDLFYFGEAHPKSHDYLWSLLLATVGERQLGLNANQLLSVSRWAMGKNKLPITLVADGPRSSVIALAAAALDEKSIGRVDVIAPTGSLKQIVEANRAFNESPELFCFGLLEVLDVKDLAALVAPRPVVVRNPDERSRKEFAVVGGWYRLLGSEHDPLK
jgi:hypothetical protein